MTLEARISRLEERTTARGPLLLSWRLDPDARATTEYGGRRFTQERGESREDFFARIGRSVPATAVVWVEQLDETL